MLKSVWFSSAYLFPTLWPHMWCVSSLFCLSTFTLLRYFSCTSALLLALSSPSLGGESSGNFLFFRNQQLTALPLPCYEQMSSSCKRKCLELVALSKRGLFSKEGHLSDDAPPCCCLAPWIPFSPSGFYGFACSGQVSLCLLPGLDYHGSSLE